MLSSVIAWLPLRPAASTMPPSARSPFELISNFVNNALLSEGISGGILGAIMPVEATHPNLRMIFQSFSEVLCTFNANAAPPEPINLIGDIQARQRPHAGDDIGKGDNA